MRTFALVLAIAAAGLGGCTEDSPLGGVCGSGFNAETGTVGDFGAGDAAQKVEALLHASADLYSASVAVEADVRGACTSMAADLGIAASELAPATGELPVTAACKRVAEEIDTIIATMPTGVALGISVTPAQCNVDIEVSATCAAECDVSITGTAMVECSGELHGSCSGSCSGECAVMGNVSCTGSCSGSCTGTCSGTCHGACTGTCSKMDAQGNCVGTCSGTCTGTCSASCSGTCSGTCTSTVTGSCTGECSGMCNATWDAECTGEADVMANADCKAACDTSANAKATCDPPVVTIVAVALTNPTASARVAALVATLRTNYPKLLRAQQRVQLTIAPSLPGFATALQAASTSLRDVGVQGTACLVSAVQAVTGAASEINASVSISIEVSASVSASGSTN